MNESDNMDENLDQNQINIEIDDEKKENMMMFTIDSWKSRNQCLKCLIITNIVCCVLEELLYVVSIASLI